MCSQLHSTIWRPAHDVRLPDPQLPRAAVRTTRADGRAAFHLLREQDRIMEIADVNQRYSQIAADYLAGHEARQNTLVVSPGNDEPQALNAEIRKLSLNAGTSRSTAMSIKFWCGGTSH